MGSLAAQCEAQDRSVGAQLPRYRCHKEVYAVKIKAVEKRVTTIAELDRILSETPTDGDDIGGYIQPVEESGIGVISVSSEFMRKHNPEAGGYFVVYQDGYRSFSPAAAFEEGYTRI